MNETAIYPGSFDPFTLGHADILEKALPVFCRIHVAVGYNESKTGWIPVEERVRAIAELYKDNPRVVVGSYSCLTADYAAQVGARYILRGVRSVKDYEYELQMADVNRRLSGVETFFLPASPDLACISSSMVRELAHFGKDISSFLPENIKYDIINLVRK